MDRLLYISISQDKPELAFLEMSKILNRLSPDKCRLIHYSVGIALFKCSLPPDYREIFKYLRLSYIKELGLIDSYIESRDGVSASDIYGFLDSLTSSSSRGKFRITRMFIEDVELYIDWIYIRKRYSSIDSEREASLIITPRIVALGYPIARRDKLQFDTSSSISIDFRSPGSMNMVDQNFMINLLYLYIGGDLGSGGRYRRVFLDPFMGTGKFILRPCLDGLTAVGSDLVDHKCMSAYMKLQKYGCRNPIVVVSDSTLMPFRDGSIDYIVTDLPYGRQSSIRYHDRRLFISRILEELVRVLKRGGLAIIAVSHSQWLELESVESYGFESLAIVSQYVHSSLIRIYSVLRKRV